MTIKELRIFIFTFIFFLLVILSIIIFDKVTHYHEMKAIKKMMDFPFEKPKKLPKGLYYAERRDYELQFLFPQ